MDNQFLAARGFGRVGLSQGEGEGLFVIRYREMCEARVLVHSVVLSQCSQVLEGLAGDLGRSTCTKMA